MLWLYKRVVFGKLVNSDLKQMVDLNKSELFILSCLAVPTLFFGFYPEPLLETMRVSVDNLIDNYNYDIKNKKLKIAYFTRSNSYKFDEHLKLIEQIKKIKNVEIKLGNKPRETVPLKLSLFSRDELNTSEFS